MYGADDEDCFCYYDDGTLPLESDFKDPPGNAYPTSSTYDGTGPITSSSGSPCYVQCYKFNSPVSNSIELLFDHIRTKM